MEALGDFVASLGPSIGALFMGARGYHYVDSEAESREHPCRVGRNMEPKHYPHSYTPHPQVGPSKLGKPQRDLIWRVSAGKSEGVWVRRGRVVRMGPSIE